MDEFDELHGDGANRKTGCQGMIIVALVTLIMIAMLARTRGVALVTGLARDNAFEAAKRRARAAERFGSFQSSDRRPQLWARFVTFMREVAACDFVEGVLVDGSFVTAVAEPNDIDLVLVLSVDHDFSADFRSSEYNVLSRRRVNRRFGFDVLVARADSEAYRRYLGFFQQVRLEPDRKKGILKIWLR
jgi:hypothetical protein